MINFYNVNKTRFLFFNFFNKRKIINTIITHSTTLIFWKFRGLFLILIHFFEYEAFPIFPGTIGKRKILPFSPT